MKKLIVVFGALLVALISITTVATDFNQLMLTEISANDPWLKFATEAATWGGFILDESDANAVCLTLDLPTGSATVVPVLLLASATSDYGYFNGQTQPALAIEDLDGDSWIRLSFSADDTPVLSVGGVATGITIPAVTGYSWTDDVDLAMGTGSDVSLEFSTADSNAHYLMVDLPTGAADSVPVMGLVSADADLGYFNGVVEPTFFVENLAGTSYVSLDHSGTTLARLVAGGAATELRFVTPAGADIIFDGGDVAANSSHQYVSITGTTPAHASGTTTNTFFDITPTFGINTGAADYNLIDLTFTSQAWATAVASNLRGIYFAPTIGNATLGTNAVALIDVAAITGDAQVSLYGIRAGALTGTAATENFIEIGAGWDNGINSASLITGTLGLTVTGAAVNLNASSNFAVNIGTGTTTEAVTIGGTGTQTIAVGDGAGVKTVALGSATSTSSTAINSGTGDMTITSVDDLSILGGSAGSILNFGTNTDGNVIHIGDNDTTADAITIGSAKDTTILAGISTTVGSTGTTSATTIQSGTGDLALTSTDDITLTVNTAVTDNITLTNTQGTNAAAIAITATAGGVDIDAAAALDVNVAGGQVLLVSKDNAASAIALTANIGTSETIVLTNTQGTGEGALTFTATAGGLDFNAATGKNIDFLGGQFIVLSNENVASAISLTTNTGTSETIVLNNTQGTGESAITLAATAGGVNVDAAAAKDLDLAGGQVKLVSKDDAASAISLTANIGTSETIVVTNTQGTSESAITLAATAGGVNVDAAAAKDLDLAGGQVKLVSKDDVAGAISLTSNIGTSETITVTNTQGTAAGAIALTATAGGITLNSAGAITATSVSGAGAVVAGVVTAVEQGINGIHKTVLTIVATGNLALEDKDDGAGVKIYDFPDGVISILGASCNLELTSDAAITTSYVASLGSAVGADASATLTGTEANIIPSTVVTCGAGNEDFHGALLTLLGIDSAGGGADLYLNVAVAAGDISAPSNVAGVAAGTITIYWTNNGDY